MRGLGPPPKSELIAPGTLAVLPAGAGVDPIIRLRRRSLAASEEALDRTGPTQTKHAAAKSSIRGRTAPEFASAWVSMSEPGLPTKARDFGLPVFHFRGASRPHLIARHLECM